MEDEFPKSIIYYTKVIGISSSFRWKNNYLCLFSIIIGTVVIFITMFSFYYVKMTQSGPFGWNGPSEETMIIIAIILGMIVTAVLYIMGLYLYFRFSNRNERKKKNKPVKMIKCPRCMTSVDSREKVCPKCYEKL